MLKSLLLLGTLFFVSCTNNNELATNGTDIKRYKSTEVYVNGNFMQEIPETRSLTFDTKKSEGYETPIDGKYTVFYFIRIDGNIPGEQESDCKSEEYFPQTSNRRSMLDDLNMGEVLDNDEWKHTIKFSKYIYDPTGGKIQDIIVKEPTLEDLVNANMSSDDFTGYLEHKDELKFIWYICKKQDSDHVWHIDGVLTTKDKNDVSETIYGDEIAGKYTDIEVDIHEQDHKDWGEIKTSIHVRSTTDIEVTLPIESEFVEPADDFAIRAFDYRNITPVNNSVTFEGLKVVVSHDNGNTTIKVNGVTDELLKAHHGKITIEVHSYYNVLSDEELWDRLKLSKVKVSNASTGVYGQIHYKDDPTDKWVKL